jgi:hypothetical protein
VFVSSLRGSPVGGEEQAIEQELDCFDLCAIDSICKCPVGEDLAECRRLIDDTQVLLLRCLLIACHTPAPYGVAAERVPRVSCRIRVCGLQRYTGAAPSDDVRCRRFTDIDVLDLRAIIDLPRSPAIFWQTDQDEVP